MPSSASLEGALVTLDAASFVVPYHARSRAETLDSENWSSPNLGGSNHGSFDVRELGSPGLRKCSRARVVDSHTFKVSSDSVLATTRNLPYNNPKYPT